jgi:hypothetical protein
MVCLTFRRRPPLHLESPVLVGLSDNWLRGAASQIMDDGGRTSHLQTHPTQLRCSRSHPGIVTFHDMIFPVFRKSATP